MNQLVRLHLRKDLITLEVKPAKLSNAVATRGVFRDLL